MHLKLFQFSELHNLLNRQVGIKLCFKKFVNPLSTKYLITNITTTNT